MLKARYFPWILLATLGALGVGLWTSGSLSAAKPLSRPIAGPDHLKEKHFVTPRQLADSNTMLQKVFDAVGADQQRGGAISWDTLSAGRPVVLVFIKHDCPCSVEFEPFFQRLEHLYRDVASFAGVIDADVAEAQRYAAEQRVPYPVLADRERRIIRRLRAENGGYFVLLTPDRVIDGFWPGCSAEGMRELGRRISQLTHVPERLVDTSGMPAPLTTGCPFDSQNP